MIKVLSCPSLMKLIKLGICAMPRKVNNPHMKNILENFQRFEEFKIIIFTEEIIFKTEIEDWPLVDALIIFYSDGFPYNKALKYINLRKPFLVNDFEMQKVFWDRVKVLKLLEEAQIPIPPHIILDGSENEEINHEENNELNNSLEKEKKVERYKKQINDIENKENNKILDMKRIINKNTKSANLKNSMNFINNKETNNNSEKDNNTIETLSVKSSDEIKDDNIFLERKQSNPISAENDLLEFDDHIEYHGIKLFKPFVEKPINGDDHDIYIYYPPNLGGGHKRLFRKTKEYSSFYFPSINEIRRDKKYIYEKFLPTDGFDIKVYTIGEKYAHAEARKSPSLDGKVNRTPEGKEVRYPINLTPKEKEIARKIVLKFKQNICGFDILRCEGNSYVCDVNGFSFVKGNKKYYEDCSILIRKIVYKGLDLPLKNYKRSFIKSKPLNIYRTLKVPKFHKFLQQKEELRSIVAVFRHADRSPKQKMKLVVEDKYFLALFDEYGKSKEKIEEIKLKKPKELTRVLKIVNEILERKKDKKEIIATDKNFYKKIFQIKMVLESNLNFNGLTRKIQLKPLKYTESIDPSGNKRYTITKALMILKWGGFLTHTGSNQAKVLGETFRFRLYPTSDDEKKNGLLRLHSTYRHDLKCYSADEGRCLKTAANFLAGLLEMEGSIIPIITSMVTSDEKSNKLLDLSSDEIHEIKKEIKSKLSECLNYDGPIKDKFNSMFTKESIYDKEDNSENESDDDGNINEINDENEGCSSSESSEENSKDNKPSNNKSININISEEKKEEKKEVEYPIYELLDKIGNPLTRMKKVLTLLQNVIENIQQFLPEEIIEQESNNYLITNKKQIERRENFLLKKAKDHLVSKILGEDKNETKRKNSDKTLQKIQKNKNKNISPSNKDKEKDKEKKIKKNEGEKKNELYYDCLDENIVLIYKRYVKLKNDFYNTKKSKFDISKIPDIYDNIKYDIIHNKDLMNSDAYDLFDEISILANFVMPFEYGITRDEKVNIGLKIIKPLLNKIYSDLIDLIDINSNAYDKKRSNSIHKEDQNWSGLDTGKMNKNEIKSTNRHVKSRFYFTCSSHIYALINIIGYGYNSILTHNNKKSFKELQNIFDFDYCSHVIFRLFEDLNVDWQNPKRFRLEIIMSPGSNKNPKEANEEHLISVSPWIFLNKNLNMEKMKQFLSKFN